MNGEERLSSLEFFRGVTKETKEQIWQKGRVMKCPKGTILRRAKEENREVCIQMSGKSAIYNLTHTGKRKIIFIFGTGHMLNEHVLQNHVISLYCETIEESEIFLISTDDFIREMRQDFTLVEAVLEDQERRVWRLGHQLKNTVGSIYLERKLAAKLWKLSRDFGKQTPEGTEIDINLSITFLADMLGAPRETTSRVCNTLTDYGLIRIKRRRIVIVDKEKMSLFYKTGKYDDGSSEKLNL